MNSMICRLLLENFSCIYLEEKLYYCNHTLSILFVNSFILIMST